MTFTASIELLRTALMSYLSGGDATRNLPGINELLARDPEDDSGTLPALFVGMKSQSPPVYPSITYRVATGSPDNQMRNEGGGLARTAIRLRIELEIWSGSSGTDQLAQIAGRIEALLHNQGFTLGNSGAGSSEALPRCYRSLFTVCQPDLFDKTANCWFGLYAYELFVQLP